MAASSKAATHEHRQRRHDQPFFQVHKFEKAFQLPIWRKESLGDGKCLGEDGKENPLVPAQDGQASEQQSVSVEGAMPDPQTWHGHKITKQAKSDEKRHSEPRRANVDCTLENNETCASHLEMFSDVVRAIYVRRGAE